MNQADLMLSQDKANHVVWGYLVACASAFTAAHCGIHPAVGAQLGSFAAGLIKEGIDWKFRTGVFDRADLAVTTVAGTPVALLFI